ncbi:MAG TPA: ester cyclase [Terriglobales bacterium]|nr:ester cyclase [Terriglobales bacterium]
MPMTREQMDQVVTEHFMYEAMDNIEGVLGSLVADAEHEMVPSPMGGALHNADQIRAFYNMLFADIKGEDVTPVRRLYGDTFMVDEAIWHGRVENGRSFGCAGKSGKVSFRILHVFEFRDGKISRENVWCDIAAIQQQLGVTALAASS